MNHVEKLNEIALKLIVLKRTENENYSSKNQLFASMVNDLDKIILEIKFHQVEPRILNDLQKNICFCIEKLLFDENQARTLFNVIRLIAETNRVDLDELALIQMIETPNSKRQCLTSLKVFSLRII